MQAGTFISWLQRRLSEQFSRTLLLEEVNAAQNEVLSMPEVDLMRVKGNVFLSTTTGVFEYPLPYRKVSRVFTRTRDGHDIGEYRNPRISGYNPRSIRDVGDYRYEEVDVSFDFQPSPSPGTSCVLHFPADQDLGNSDDRYLLEAYTWPVQLTSEQIVLTLPEQYCTTLLYYAVKKRVEESAYGVDIYNDPLFLRYFQQFTTENANHPRQTQSFAIPRW